MNQVVKSNALKYGLIAAGIGVAFTVLGYAVAIDILVNFWATSSLFVLSIVLFIVGISTSKKQMGGFIAFKDAFTSYIVSYLVAGATGIVVTYLLFNVVDPSAAETLKELSIETTVNMMEDWGAPEETIEQAIEQAENQNPMALGSQLQAFLLSIIFHGVIGLIAAAIMKKNRPAHLENMDAESFGEND
jgi:hypothetical protein